MSIEWIKITPESMPMDEEIVLVANKFGWTDAICENQVLYYLNSAGSQVDALKNGFTHFAYVPCPRELP